MNQSILGAKYCLVNRLVRVDYRTTNLTTSKGRALRTVTLDRRGTASETAFGATDDVRPFWNAKCGYTRQMSNPRRG